MAVAIIKVLNKRLIDAQQRVKSLALDNTHGRTARMLMKLAMEHGVKTEKGVELELPYPGRNWPTWWNHGRR